MNDTSEYENRQGQLRDCSVSTSSIWQMQKHSIPTAASLHIHYCGALFFSSRLCFSFIGLTAPAFAFVYVNIITKVAMMLCSVLYSSVPGEMLQQKAMLLRQWTLLRVAPQKYILVRLKYSIILRTFSY